MSRHGLEDGDGDYDDNLQAGRWAGALKSAIRGKRGQAFLRELAAALDAMPVKELIESELVSTTGECCALGAVAISRGIDVSEVILDDDGANAAHVFGISQTLVRAIEYENDDAEWPVWPPRPGERPVGWTYKQELERHKSRRWLVAREWVRRNIAEPSPA